MLRCCAQIEPLSLRRYEVNVENVQKVSKNLLYVDIIEKQTGDLTVWSRPLIQHSVPSAPPRKHFQQMCKGRIWRCRWDVRGEKLLRGSPFRSVQPSAKFLWEQTENSMRMDSTIRTAGLQTLCLKTSGIRVFLLQWGRWPTETRWTGALCPLRVISSVTVLS